MEKKFTESIRSSKESGITWLFSWTLFVSLNIFPGIHLRKISKRKSALWIIELYVVSKTLFSFLALYYHWFNFWLILLILVLLLTETILYNLFFILCSNLIGDPASPKRSLILGFFNYLEVVFSFAALYQYNNVIVYSSAENALTIGSLDYTFFSVAVGGVLGFGDYTIVSALGKKLAMLQCTIFIMFFILFITYNLTLFIPEKAEKQKEANDNLAGTDKM